MAALAAVALSIAGCGGSDVPGEPSDNTVTNPDGTVSHNTVTIELHVESLISGTLQTEPVYEVTVASLYAVDDPTNSIGDAGISLPLILEGVKPGPYEVIVACPDHENVEETFVATGSEPVYVHTIVLKPYDYVEPDAPVEIGMYKYEYFQDGTTHRAKYDDELVGYYQSEARIYWFKGQFGQGYPEGCRVQPDDPTKIDCSGKNSEGELTYVSGVVIGDNEQFEITVYMDGFDSEIYSMNRLTRM